MFKLIKRLFLKKKAKTILSYIENLKPAFDQVRIIKNADKDTSAILSAISKDKQFANVVSAYNDYMQRVAIHNKHVLSVCDAYTSLIDKHPIAEILENILIYSKKTIEEYYKILNSSYEYVFANPCRHKEKYVSYKASIEEILRNYGIIKEQKSLIQRIDIELDNLPDIYIDPTNDSTNALNNVLTLIDTYGTYERKYFKAPIIDENVIDRHNALFIERHLRDPIFDNVTGKNLDDEQRKAILCDAKSNLTIAGAGAGKTLTICGKVKYLLATGAAKENEILLLSYSRASANDLENKVSQIADNLTVETFHALGLKILTEVKGKKSAVEEQLKAYINQFFEEKLEENPRIANDIFQYFALYFYATPIYKKKYKNDGEIFNELKTSDFTTLKDRLRKLSLNKDKHETLKKEFVKSNEELIIANYLFINGINYAYERPYEIDTSTPNKRQYTPDFYLIDYGIYLEHYGIDENGNAPQYDKEASEEYIRSIQWKRRIHGENKTKCLETYSYEFNDGTIFDRLKTRLLENGVEFRPLEQTDVFKALHNIHAEKDFSSLFNLVTTFISLYKAQFKDSSGFDELKKQFNDSLYNATRSRLFLDICKELYHYYMLSLRNSEKIDFDDMILQSTELLDFTQKFRYKYIIVDEFQDISQSRTKFLQKLIAHGNSKLFAVGDDWQAIYRFTGCDINVFLNFEKIFIGAKLNFITKTHRNSAELQEIAEPFITANPNQYKKHIKSALHQKNPVKIIYHNGNKADALTKALTDINAIATNAKVLVLGRNKHDIDAVSCKKIQIHNYKTIKHADYPAFDLSYSTVHSAKGLECDFVVLISGEDAQNGFPNKTEDDAILTLLLGKESSFEYAEERRLFYVALTRTKHTVYLLADQSCPSIFIQEIKNKCFILEEESNDKEENEYSCPWCKSGHLVVKKSETTGKSFYGCSNYPYCCYTNNNMQAVHDNHRCPECGDFLILRRGKFGAFFGCHNYPYCKHTQQNVETKKRNRIGFYE